MYIVYIKNNIVWHLHTIITWPMISCSTKQTVFTIQVFRSNKYRHNIMLLWFVKIYERNLKKLQFTTQRFDTPV